MQAVLSFDQAPPLGAPLRFFLTAPIFAMLAGLLLLVAGPALFASRWTPEALALTHLVTVGFMLQTMFGALLQILPVMAGANIARPRLVAGLVHVPLTAGVLALAGAFLSYSPAAFVAAAALLAGGVFIFLAAAGLALHRVPSHSPAVAGLKVALFGLGGTVLLGLLLILGLNGILSLPLLELANVHLGWGLMAWGCVLLSAVGYVVVPMFQMTPGYPVRFGRYFPFITTALIAGWSLVDSLWPDGRLAESLSALVLILAGSFAGLTLFLQQRSKRAKFDVTQRYWQVAMICTLLACLLWLFAHLLPTVGEWQGWPLLSGILILCGGFMSVIVGMLYKIVPFLIWMHLQHRGSERRILAPNMKKVLAEGPMRGQMLAHFTALALLLLAVHWPLFTYPAGLAVLVANGWLLRNLWSALTVYRFHLRKIEAAVVGSA